MKKFENLAEALKEIMEWWDDQSSEFHSGVDTHNQSVGFIHQSMAADAEDVFFFNFDGDDIICKREWSGYTFMSGQRVSGEDIEFKGNVEEIINYIKATLS